MTDYQGTGIQKSDTDCDLIRAVEAEIKLEQGLERIEAALLKFVNNVESAFRMLGLEICPTCGEWKKAAKGIYSHEICMGCTMTRMKRDENEK